MQSFKNFIKRNAPVFFLGLIILMIFVIIILSSPKIDNNIPAGFRKVEEKVFEREPAEPTPGAKTTEYAPQIPSLENKGKPYFYGEYDPDLRDSQGYPIPPKFGSTTAPSNLDKEGKIHLQIIEEENYNLRTQPIYIDFTKDGFSPADKTAFTGQKIIWTNKTDKNIKIVQTVPVHESLINGVNLKPGESYEFRPLVDKQFTYAESTSLKYGSLTISDTTLPLVKLD